MMGARGAAFSNSRPQPGAKTFGGLEGEGGGRVGWSGAGLPRRGRWVPQHTYLKMIPLIIWSIHNWGKKFSEKICPLAQAPVSQGPTRRSGRGQFFLCAFQPFVNSPPNSEHFEYRRRVKKKPRQEAKKKNSAPSAPTLSPKISIWRKTGSKTLGDLRGRGGGWGLEFEQAAPLGWGAK